MSKENGDITSAAEIMAASVKAVTLPESGFTVMIRKVTSFDLAPTGKLYTSMPEDEQAIRQHVKKVVEESDSMKTFRVAVMEGVVKPVVRNCSWRHVGEDEIHISAFGQNDILWLADQIIEFSGLGGATSEKTKPFSEEQGTGGDATSDGKGISSRTVTADEDVPG